MYPVTPKTHVWLTQCLSLMKTLPFSLHLILSSSIPGCCSLFFSHHLFLVIAQRSLSHIDWERVLQFALSKDLGNIVMPFLCPFFPLLPCSHWGNNEIASLGCPIDTMLKHGQILGPKKYPYYYLNSKLSLYYVTKTEKPSKNNRALIANNKGLISMQNLNILIILHWCFFSQFLQCLCSYISNIKLITFCYMSFQVIYFLQFTRHRPLES